MQCPQESHNNNINPFSPNFPYKSAKNVLLFRTRLDKVI